jgi:hypothetical protein
MRVVIEKLTVAHPAKRFPEVCGNQRFFSMFITALHWIVSSAR